MRTVPTVMRLDYGARTDANPEYVGMARQGAADDDTTWTLYKFTWESTTAGIARPTSVAWVENGSWATRSSWF